MLILYIMATKRKPATSTGSWPKTKLVRKLAYLDSIDSRATATWDPSRVCDLHHSSWQHLILNPLIQARDGTHKLMVPSRIHFSFFRALTNLLPLRSTPIGSYGQIALIVLLKQFSLGCFLCHHYYLI